MDRLGIIVIYLNYEGSDINMNRLGSLITQLESTEKYDKENILIEIYIYLQETEMDLNESQRVFVNLSQLRDISLADGSQAFFDDWGKELIDIKVLAKYISSNSCKMLEKLIQKQYLEFDEWIAENQWIFNDELSNIVRSYFGV